MLDAFRSLLFTVIKICNYRLIWVQMIWSRALHKLQEEKKSFVIHSNSWAIMLPIRAPRPDCHAMLPLSLSFTDVNTYVLHVRSIYWFDHHPDKMILGKRKQTESYHFLYLGITRHYPQKEEFFGLTYLRSWDSGFKKLTLAGKNKPLSLLVYRL